MQCIAILHWHWNQRQWKKRKARDSLLKLLQDLEIEVLTGLSCLTLFEGEDHARDQLMPLALLR